MDWLVGADLRFRRPSFPKKTDDAVTRRVSFWPGVNESIVHDASKNAAATGVVPDERGL
jgi:hypothetical protein